MPSALRSAVLQLKTARRVIPRGGGPIRERLGRPDERLVFVIGCPRSGTTFLGGAVGTLPGFVDLGEVHALKASIPELAALPPEEAAPRIRRLLDATRRIGLVGARRAVEQTPETSFVARAAALAFPEAAFLHIVRDGRDVVCSLLERGWLSGGREGTDDAGLPYGAEPRFWVEAGRREEFTVVSDARRAAWAWRRYVGAARALGDRAVEVRYERLSSDPGTVAAELAERLGVDADPLATRLAQAHAASVGRFRTELGPDRLADVEDEAGALLAELGYVD